MSPYVAEDHMPRTDEAWRDHVADELRKIASEFRIGDERMNAFEENLAKNTHLTTEMHKDTGELLEIFKTMKSGMKVLGWLGTGFRWIVGVGAAAATLWAICSGNAPK